MSELYSVAEIVSLYRDSGLSIRKVAQRVGLSKDKVSKILKEKKILRDKSQAQKNALKKGVSQHPTEGRTRTQAEKNKIGDGVSKSWDELSDEEMEQRKKVAADNWKSFTPEQREHRERKREKALREASKTGSKLEKFLALQIMENGWSADVHNKRNIGGTNMHLDIFIPELATAIEIDGPTHNRQVYNDKGSQLAKIQEKDRKKNGIVIQQGYNMVRVKQLKNTATPAYMRKKWDELFDVLTDISAQQIHGELFVLDEN